MADLKFGHCTNHRCFVVHLLGILVNYKHEEK